MPFFVSFGQDFLDPENRLYRREATRTLRHYRRVSDYLEIAFLYSPHMHGMRLAARMRAFISTTAIIETSPFAMLSLLWCLAFACAVKDLSLLLVCTTAYAYISCRTTACFFLSTTAVTRATADVLYILKSFRTS